MTTVYIDSILYSPKDYNSMYNYNQYNPYENKQNNILDIINTTKKMMLLQVMNVLYIKIQMEH